MCSLPLHKPVDEISFIDEQRNLRALLLAWAVVFLYIPRLLLIRKRLETVELKRWKI